MENDFNKLDQMYRVSEKEELKKFLELGKTPAQYYQEQENRGKISEVGKAGTIRETLLSKESEDGFEISVIEGLSQSGQTYEQVRISAE